MSPNDKQRVGQTPLAVYQRVGLEGPSAQDRHHHSLPASGAAGFLQCQAFLMLSRKIAIIHQLNIGILPSKRTSVIMGETVSIACKAADSASPNAPCHRPRACRALGCALMKVTGFPLPLDEASRSRAELLKVPSAFSRKPSSIATRKTRRHMTSLCQTQCNGVILRIVSKHSDATI